MNGLRVDFNPSTHALNGILLEPAATNLLPSSTNISATAYWSRNGSPTFNQTVVAPDNSNSFSIVSATSFTGIYKSVPVLASTAYTYSLYFKYVSGSPTIRVGLGAGFLELNAQTGTITATSGVTGTPVSSAVGNGWYRVAMTVTSGGTATSMTAIAYNRLAAATEVAYWGLQIEQGTTASSHIATSAGAVTRAADIYQMP